MKKTFLFIMTITLSSFSVADGFNNNFKDIATPNNWSDSMKRWSKGNGAWNNWRDWGKTNNGNRNPMNVMTDMTSDMTAEAMGDAVAEVEFEFWVKSNFKAKTWYQLNNNSKYNAFNYWKHRVQPFQQYQQNNYQNP